MARRSTPRYWLSKRAQRKTGYPLATIAYDDPDVSTATKVVVGISPTASETAPGTLQTWFSTGQDLRADDTITIAILTSLNEHQIVRVTMLDQLLGCPHEEGIDAPDFLVVSMIRCSTWARSSTA